MHEQGDGRMLNPDARAREGGNAATRAHGRSLLGAAGRGEKDGGRVPA